MCIYSYPRAEINKLLPSNITVDTLSDAMIEILKQRPDFLNSETGARVMVSADNLPTFIRTELNKFGDYLVSQQTRVIYELVQDPHFIDQVISASMRKIPSDQM